MTFHPPHSPSDSYSSFAFQTPFPFLTARLSHLPIFPFTRFSLLPVLPQLVLSGTNLDNSPAPTPAPIPSPTPNPFPALIFARIRVDLEKRNRDHCSAQIPQPHLPTACHTKSPAHQSASSFTPPPATPLLPATWRGG